MKNVEMMRHKSHKLSQSLFIAPCIYTKIFMYKVEFDLQYLLIGNQNQHNKVYKLIDKKYSWCFSF